MTSPNGSRASLVHPPRLRDRAAFAVLIAGALAAVLAVRPYRLFDLDRFFAPKELALHLAALLAGLALLSGARRAALTRVDIALAAWVALSIASALFASNHWLAFRALSITVSGAVVFWSARRLAAAGLGGALARALAAAVVIGSLTALAQAYGLRMEFAALNRAPGGTFGNRNFMAHLAAIGVPLLLFCIATARSKLSAGLWTLSLAACAGALVLSRTRAAWLALFVSAGAALLVAVRGPALIDVLGAKRRLALAVTAAAAGVALALVVPNALDWRSENPYLESVVGVVNYREGSGRGRIIQYANTAKMALAHPVVGVGPGNWPVAYPRYAPVDDPSLIEGAGMTANPWPSSDWMAALSERGVLALFALAVAMLWLLGGALAVRYDSSQPAPARLAAVAGGAALGLAMVEGAFDAVLLLPTPTLIVWALAGALLPARREVRSVTLSGSRRLAALVVVGAAGAWASVTSMGRIEAMRLSTLGTLPAHEKAVSYDPGSYRVRMRAADAYAARGQCAKARAHATAARALLPAAQAPRRLLGQCR
jgi:O-antigen ligase